MNHLSTLPFRFVVVFAAVLYFTACGEVDKKTSSVSSRPGDTVSTGPSPFSPTSQPVAASPLPDQDTKYLGPRVLTDSIGTNPRLERKGDEYVVHIPQSMVRLLRDSLPGFSPLELSAWDPAVVSYVASRRPGYVLPSVVIGDFNGDSKSDLAMMGNAREGSATFILLAESDRAPLPRIVYIGRGESIVGSAEVYISLIRPQIIRSDPTLESQPLDLKTDAVLEVVIEKASLLYYLDRGTLRSYTISD